MSAGLCRSMEAVSSRPTAIVEAPVELEGPAQARPAARVLLVPLWFLILSAAGVRVQVRQSEKAAAGHG